MSMVEKIDKETHSYITHVAWCYSLGIKYFNFFSWLVGDEMKTPQMKEFA